MPRQQMEDLLVQLRKEVAGARELSDSQRARMAALEEQIAQRLAADEVEDGNESPKEVVQGYIDEFQRTHPTLTMVLGRILDSLNKMGI
jgi:phage shock protein A